MPVETPLLILIDGHALVHRAYHAFASTAKGRRPAVLTLKSGEPVAAVYGFAMTLLKVVADFKPDYLAVAFDPPGPTFRHEQYAEYKAQRGAAPEDLHHQIQRVRELLDAFRIPIYELSGYEADDVLGALSRQASAQGIRTIIATGDADIMQLVSPQVQVLYPHRTMADSTLYDEARVLERYGVTPAQVPDMKGLKGDPSDNIPGVPGVGDKTAAKLLQAFGSVEGVYQNLWLVGPPKLQETLQTHGEQARMSKRLATIVTDLPVSLNLEACRVHSYDRARVVQLFRELGFASLLSKLPSTEEEMRQPQGQLPPAPSRDVPVRVGVERRYRTVDTEEKLGELVEHLKACPVLAVDVETTSTYPMEARLVGIALSPAPGEAYYLPVGHRTGPQLPLGLALERLQPLLQDPGLPKAAHNGSYDIVVLAEHGAPLKDLSFDTMIAAHLVGEKALGLKNLAFGRLGEEMTPISELIGTGAKQITMAEVPIAQAALYACADADMTGRLHPLLEAELRKEGLWHLFAEVEMPLVPVLVQMERDGVALDLSVLRQMSRDLGEEMARLEVEIYNQVGHRFNLNSTQQLGVVLFEELDLPKARRTKSGYSTDAAVLEGLRGAHPVIDLMLEYRQVTKLKSTYVDALPALVNSKTGRVHTSFNQVGSATGRVSSSDPNLQNIPVRSELGRQVRQAFVAGDQAQDSLLLSADYSQIELRILAHISQDPRLLEAFHQDEDIHVATASEVFGVPQEAVTSEQRRIAKTVNFGVIYGLSGYGLSQQVAELSQQEANQFITAYFEKYSGIRDYVASTKRQVAEQGYVQTLLGRKRSIPEIHSSNFAARAAAERMAVNMPIQGTAADIIKVAMVRLFNEMQRRGLSSKMILQVHDELLFETPRAELAEMEVLVPQVMSQAVELQVPLKVDLKVGRTWGELE